MNEQTATMPENITQQFLRAIKLPSPSGKRLRYLFVMPIFAKWDDTAYRMPYGFCLVSSALKASGRDVFTLNLNYKTNPYDLLRETIISNDIDVVLTGGLSGQYTIVKKILDTAKSVKPGIITCVGGGILTADPPATMRAMETADYGIIGEGEITVNSFAYALENKEDAGQEAGIITRDGIMGPPRPGIFDLDILPFPDYDGFELHLLLRDDLFHSGASSSVQVGAVPIATSRSCPYQCTFCFSTCDKKYRRRSFESTRQELDWVLCKYPEVNMIQFNDEMLGNDTEFLQKLTDYMKKCNLQYQIFQRVDMISRDVLQCLKDSGCRHVFFGVESGDNRILRSMRKNITVEQIERAFDLALEIGLSARGYIILGDLEETPETIRNTLYWWKNHPNYDITINWILTLPGTHIYKIACERGIIADKVQYLKDGDMQINMTKMPDDIYWNMVQKVSLFQILSTNGVDVDFDDMDNTIVAIRRHLDNLTEEHKIALWPAKFETVAMLNEISPKFVASTNVFFANVNPYSSYVAACERFGKRVRTPDEIMLSANIDAVLYVYGDRATGSAPYNQINKTIKERYSNVNQLLRITDLTDEFFSPALQNESSLAFQ